MKKIFSVFSTFIIVLAASSVFSSVFPQQTHAACGGPVPPTPKNFKAVTAGAGQVTLYWDEAAYANRYAVAYGTVSGKYVYGADNIGGAASRSYTVKALTAGVRYYFKLAAARDCSASGFTAEVSAVAGGGQVAAAVPVGGSQVREAAPQTAVPLSGWVSSGPVGKQKLTASPGPGVGTVTLKWQMADSEDNYHLVYGTAPGKYQYGALNIGKITKFAVRHLVPGKKYYFALVPLMGNRPLYTTDQVAATAWMPVEVVETSARNLIEPKPINPTVLKEKKETPPAEQLPQQTTSPSEATPVSESAGGVMGVSDQQQEKNIAF